jgi:cation:H+ antiporter
MDLLQFKGYPLWANLAVFAFCALAVWLAGTRVARYADTIARRTGLSHAAAGLLLLAGVTSLPEVAVTVTASAGGNAELAVNNLLGSIAMQVTILAVADALIGKDALTSVIPDPVVLLQLALNILLLSLFAAAALIGDVGFLGIGAWSSVLLAAYVGSVWVIAKSHGRKPWVAGDGRPAEKPVSKKQDEEKDRARALVTKTTVAAAVILVAGFLLSKTGEAIAVQTGLGQSFAGFALVAISTSLPEVSTVVASVRLRQYVMAVSDIFGTNLFNVGLVFLVDVAYRGGPVLNEVGRFSVFAAVLGIVVTTIFLVGLIERRDRTIARMGLDSFATLVMYFGGLAVLYTLR